MMTLESRLATVVTLLPSAEKPPFAAPLALGESADTRLVDAVRALAKAEGLVCMTPGEFARAVAQQIAQRSIPATDVPAANAPADAQLVACGQREQFFCAGSFTCRQPCRKKRLRKPPPS